MKKILGLVLILSLSSSLISCGNSNDTSSSSITNTSNIVQSELTSSNVSNSSQTSDSTGSDISNNSQINELIPTSLDSGPYISSTSMSFIYKGNLDDLKSFYKNLGITGTETDKAPEGSGVAMSGNPYWELQGTYNGNPISIYADEVEVDGSTCNVSIDFA